MPEIGGKWVLMDTNGKCVVKGKSRRYLVGVNEKTKKETLCYATQNDAISALKRSYIPCSDYVLANYGEISRRDIVPVEIECSE